MSIHYLAIHNYRVLREVEFDPLPPLSVVIGANGAGKSTLFDVFTFLKDALAGDVHSATAKRGGYRELASRGESKPIRILIGYRGTDDPRFLYYGLAVEEQAGRVTIAREAITTDLDAPQEEQFLQFIRGEGFAEKRVVDTRDDSEDRLATYTFKDRSTLAIKALGHLEDFPLVMDFRSLIEGWHVSNFHISHARASIEAGHAEHLSTVGDNVAQVAQYLHEYHPDQFRRVLEAMRTRVPGVDAVEAKVTEDGRLVLRFKDGSFKDPFIARHVSDGTIKMFAYLLLLHDPKPHPLVAVEEPENQLYPALLHELAEEFRGYAKRGGQALVSTHSPEFLNGTELDEVFVLRKVDGFAQVKRVSDSDLLKRLGEEGDLPGALWRQRLFDAPDL